MSETRSSRKYAWVAVLYFAQGWPAGLVNKTLPIVFTAYGVDLGKIGLLSLANLPWSFKFLWAPIVDRVGARRTWIAACLLGMAALSLAFGATFRGEVGALVWILIVGIAFLSATQDIAIDAGTIELLNDKELGTANGIRVTAYRIALIVAGGGLVLLAAGLDPGRWFPSGLAGIGWPATWAATAALFLAFAGAALFFPVYPRPALLHHERLRVVAGRSLRSMALPVAAAGAAYFAAPHLFVAEKFRVPFAVLFGVAGAVASAFALAGRAAENGDNDALRRLIARRGAWAVVLFILAFKIGDAAMAPMTTPFLLRGAKLSQAEVGVLLNTFGVGGTIAGAMLGGMLTSRIGLFRALWVLGFFQAFSNLGYAYAASNPGPGVVTAAALFEAFCSGLGTAPFLAFLMKICEKAHAATQYAFLSAIYVLSNALAGAFSGYAAEAMGFGPYFTTTFFLALPAFALLPAVRGWIEAGADAPA